MIVKRRLPIGAEIVPGHGTSFRVWAPDCRAVRVEIEAPSRSVHPLESEPDGYFSGVVPHVARGARYRFLLDDKGAFPDPASRFQPEGPHGPSEVIDTSGFHWSDGSWQGCELRGQVIYELHIGTFTQEGTWAAATSRLPDLAETGITLIELMPVAEFPGEFGWGYDGVDLFAPTRLYGRPEDMQQFVDTAHRLGIGVLLDVVYNHFGPDGNYLNQFARAYFTDRYKNDWGEALNFDGPDAAPVRELYRANAAYWIEEYHLDGLRLDATDQIHDSSPTHLISEIVRTVRRAGGGRRTIVVGENEAQNTTLLRPVAEEGYEVDGCWNDDYHHTALVALTGKAEAYYQDYRGSAQELLAAAKWGYLYQGQRYAWQKKRRGTPALDLPIWRFINFLENHDQVANSGYGVRSRMLTSPGRYNTLLALTLLMPGTPMLFQGQEFGATTVFRYFADHTPELNRLVKRGRGEFLAQFPSLAHPAMQAALSDPGARETFEASKLDHDERRTNPHQVALVRDLIRIRSTDPVVSPMAGSRVDGAVLSPQSFVLRYFNQEHGDRLLIVNLGAQLPLESAPEPLLAPLRGCEWKTIFSSDDVAYGRTGTPQLESAEHGWNIPGEVAVLLAPLKSKGV